MLQHALRSVALECTSLVAHVLHDNTTLQTLPPWRWRISLLMGVPAAGWDAVVLSACASLRLWVVWDAVVLCACAQLRVWVVCCVSAGAFGPARTLVVMQRLRQVAWCMGSADVGVEVWACASTLVLVHRHGKQRRGPLQRPQHWQQLWRWRRL